MELISTTAFFGRVQPTGVDVAHLQGASDTVDISKKEISGRQYRRLAGTHIGKEKTAGLLRWIGLDPDSFSLKLSPWLGRLLEHWPCAS